MKLLMLDVDGTVTESAQVMDEEMAEILAYQERDLAFISGTGRNELYRILTPLIKRRCRINVLPEMGRAAYQGGMSLYRVGMPFSPVTAENIERDVRIWMKGFDIHPLSGDVFQLRDSQLTISLLGRSAPLGEKTRFDPQKNVRQALVERLKERFPDLHYTIGGTTSIDIQDTEWDKRYGAGMFFSFMRYDPKEVTFYGDQLGPGGNDEPMKGTGATCISVKGPEHLKDLLRL